MGISTLPANAAERDRWVLDRRPGRNVLDPWRPYHFLHEEEAGPDGGLVPVATLFLTNRECPFRCVMCDLWRNTLPETGPPGAIAAQMRYALDRLPPASWLKLYNAGSFFDRRAILPEEHPAIAALAARFERVIVECHPALVGSRCVEFRDRLSGRLEVAMGLETVHPVVLERLNKRMTLDKFRAAAKFLSTSGIDLRVFLLLRPPWLSETEGLHWAKRSLEFAFDCGASVCSVIPTRDGNGAMEALAAEGEYEPPSLLSLEVAVQHGLALRAGRVLADLWEVGRFACCPACSGLRIDRLRVMNRTQSVPRPVTCDACSAA